MRTIEEIEMQLQEISAYGSQREIDAEWLEWFRATAHGIKPDRLRTICAAEQNGTLHIAPDATSTPAWLPCKFGDILWAHSDFGDMIVPYTVEAIHISGEVYQIDCCWYNRAECMEEAEFDPSDFGQTVFLTREAAEAALKGASNADEVR